MGCQNATGASDYLSRYCMGFPGSSALFCEMLYYKMHGWTKPQINNLIDTS
jgi:hypothetical protein